MLARILQYVVASSHPLCVGLAPVGEGRSGSETQNRTSCAQPPPDVLFKTAIAPYQLWDERTSQKVMKNAQSDGGVFDIVLNRAIYDKLLTEETD